MNLNEININKISGVLNIILNAFKIPVEPIAPLPPPLILLGGSLRPGMSVSDIASRIISRTSEAGKQVGDIFADGPNVDEAMEVIRVQEIINSLLTESVVNVVIPTGIAVTTIGVGNLGAPVMTQGVTTTPAVGNGIIR